MFHNFESEGRKTARVTLRSVNKTRVRYLVLEISFLREQRRLIFIKQWRLFNMKTAVLSILFSASATRTSCFVKSDFLSRYRVFKQPASTLVSGCHFGDLMETRQRSAQLSELTTARLRMRVINLLTQTPSIFPFWLKMAQPCPPNIQML